FVRLDVVHFPLDEIEAVGCAGLGGEVVHLIIEQEAEMAGGNAGAVAEVEGIGDSHGITGRVHHGKMGGFVRLPSRHRSRADLAAQAGAIGLYAGPSLLGKLGAEQRGHGDLDEIRVAQILGTIGHGAAPESMPAATKFEWSSMFSISMMATPPDDGGGEVKMS